MHKARKFVYALLVGMVLVAKGNDIPEKTRRIVVQNSKESVSVDYEIIGAEVVLTGSTVDGRLVPFEGLVFGKENTPKDGFRFRIEISSPDKQSKKRMGDHWQVWHGVVDQDSGGGLKTVLPVKKEENRLMGTNVTIPLQVEGVEAYLIPFRTVDGESECIFVGIAKDKSLLKDTFQVLPQKDFDWESSFHPASTPMHPLPEKKGSKIHSGPGD